MSPPGVASPMGNNNIGNSRLPLTTMQASTSAPPNVIFNSPRNAQSTLNHPLISFCILKRNGSLDKQWKHLAASMHRSYLKQFLGLVTSYS
ncbi:hypothetical protein CRYUN_Cryun28dG0037500 [Craigia yunnanensis]